MTDDPIIFAVSIFGVILDNPHLPEGYIILQVFEKYRVGLHIAP